MAAISAIVTANTLQRHAQTLSIRWDKSNFAGNDDVPWLQAAAAALEEMRTDLLALGIQVNIRGIVVRLTVSGFLTSLRGQQEPPILGSSVGLASVAYQPATPAGWGGACSEDIAFRRGCSEYQSHAR